MNKWANQRHNTTPGVEAEGLPLVSLSCRSRQKLLLYEYGI
jgi:hypothetical protein